MRNHTKADKVSLKMLLQLENGLSNRLKKLSVDLSKSHSRDSSEQAVERENDEVIDKLESEASEELQQVKRAIQRIKQGKYHSCTNCESEISDARLRAIPYTTLCINCADALSI